ncbi:hypothetical protein HMPREF9999_01196 [Alloprevotella sp. oral taxon 473 str. F0040]|nr:hypothetical protein HMPREF9999_01196 [Alloprevotella sp. oral taxon 473 str. F0040]
MGELLADLLDFSTQLPLFSKSLGRMTECEGCESKNIEIPVMRARVRGGWK